MGKIDLDRVEQIISGIVAGCKEANCSLIGGETAEMPGFYQEGEYDLAGFAVGIVENSSIIDGSSIHVGDHIIGLASSGLHSNGYSLVRKIVFEAAQAATRQHPPGLLSAPSPKNCWNPPGSMWNTVLNIMRHFRVAGMAHITGGGFYDNIPRILPKTCQALIYEGTWEVPRFSTSSRMPPKSPPTKCIGSSTTASAISWWFQPKTATKSSSVARPWDKKPTGSGKSPRAQAMPIPCALFRPEVSVACSHLALIP